jgi:hypothetical protein
MTSSFNTFHFIMMLLAAFTAMTSAMVRMNDGPDAVDLGDAGNYAILAKTGISTVPASSITGDIAVSPITAAAMTGFSFTIDSTTTFSRSTQLRGRRAYAANYASPTPRVLTMAVSDMETAYTDAAGRINPDYLNLGAGDIGGRTLLRGLYKFTSNVEIPTSITFAGGSNDIFIIQTTQNVIMAAGTNVILTNGAQAKNIFWQVAGTVEVGAGAHMVGNLLVKTAVTFVTGSSLNGRVLTQTACVLQSTTVVKPS